VSWFPLSQVTPLRGGPILRWGILAPGAIAADFAATVLANTDQQVTAVASRSVDRAERFAATYGVPAVARTYEELVARPDVDIVYVASSPHQHHPLAMLAISAQKHVLVEKPLATSATDAQEIESAARSEGVFAAEAMWTAYLPQFDALRQVLDRGSLGEVRIATADVGWQVGADGPAWLYDSAQGGGAALDMGIYGYWFAQFAIGAPLQIRAVGSLSGSTGVDEQAVVALAGSDGRLASVTTSMAVTNSGLASIQGTNGSARFTRPFVFPGSLIIDTGREVHSWEDSSGLQLREGLAWQTTSIASIISAGLTDSPVHPIAQAVSVIRTIDEVRNQITPR
jgi:predicted dehydrogenase